MDGADDSAVREYYARDRERDRLTEARGVVEFERTKEIILRHLPDPPSVVADIGGGPGRYALWLAERGHQVEHRDLIPMHVRHLRGDSAGFPQVRTAVADARRLDLGDASVDAVLFLGPIYHLRRRSDRVRALREARRIVRPGGPVFVAAISRWAPRQDGVLRARLYEQYPAIRDLTTEAERTGWMPPLFPGSFAAYCHRPNQLRAELRSAGLAVAHVVNVEGMAVMLSDLDERMSDPLSRAVVLDAVRAIERVPELLGIGPHLLATAFRSR